MDHYYDSQIRSSTTTAANKSVAFAGPARQFGSGAAGLGALAVRVGRGTLPLLAKYALPLVKKVGRSLIKAAVPELGDVLRGKKKLKSAVKSSVKKGVSRAMKQAAVEALTAATKSPKKTGVRGGARAAGRPAGGGGARARPRNTTYQRQPQQKQLIRRKCKISSTQSAVSQPTRAKVSRSSSSKTKNSNILANVRFV